MRFPMMILSVLIFTSCLCTASSALFGPLTYEENEQLQGSCGQHTQAENEFEGLFLDDGSDKKYLTAISPRHIIVDAHASFLNFTYEKAKCKNNFLEFSANAPNMLGFNTKKQAFYIGSCDDDYPRGFVVLEYHLPSSKKFLPVCLSPEKPRENAIVQVFTTRSVTPKNVEFIYTRVNRLQNYDELATTALIFDYGGPVLDPNVRSKRSYIGHAFGNDDRSIYIVPIFNYLRLICDVTGVCVGSERADARAPAPATKLFSSASFFDAPTNEPIGEVNHVSFTSDDFVSIETVTESDSEETTTVFYDLAGVEVDENEHGSDRREGGEELESSGEEHIFRDYETSEGHEEIQEVFEPESTTIFFNSEEIEPQEQVKKTVFLSVVPEVRMDENVPPPPKGATIVRAEPISAIIIPLPDQEIAATPFGHTFPSAQELLIAVLIMLALLFYVCMCLYGCVDYEGESVYWKPDTGNLPY